MLDVSGPIRTALSFSPVPGLTFAFEALQHLWNAVQQVTEGRAQLNHLTLSVAEFLTILDQKSRSSPDTLESMQHSLRSLKNLLDEIVTFAENQKDKKFLKLLFEGDKAIKCVSALETRLIICCNAFNISAHIDTHQWQRTLEEARRLDQGAIETLFGQLMSNNDSLFAKLFGKLDVQHYQLVSAITAMQKAINRLDNTQKHAAERRFYEHGVSLLQRRSGIYTHSEPWTISVFETEKGAMIGSGGFSTVFRGTFLGTPVAIKELAPQTSAKQMKREIAVWRDLAHPHIIQFMGAGCFENPPFMVMPLMQNGNILEFLQRKPGFNRYRLVHQVLLGLVFLHSRKVVHGDLKGANILIDSEQKAVLSDFGLSAIKTDVTSRATTVLITGTRRWMSPERMRGRQLAPSADIYSLAMTIYEIFTGLVPFGSADEGDILALVLHEKERPERPSDSPHLSDFVWELIVSGWVTEPQNRPSASDLERSVATVLPAQVQEVPELQDWLNGSDLERSVSDPFPSQGEGPSIQAPVPRPANVPFRHVTSWNRHTLNKLGSKSFDGHSGPVMSVAFSPDGTKLVSGSSDATLRIWHLATEITTKPLPQLPAVPSQGLQRNSTTMTTLKHFFGPKSPLLTTRQGSVFRTAQLSLGPIHHGHTLFTGHKAGVLSAAFSSDGTRIVSGSIDGKIGLWDAMTGTMLSSFSAHSSSVVAVQFSPDGKRILSGSSDNTCAIWDASDVGTDSILANMTDHTSPITSAVFSPNGSRVVTGSKDKTVRVWDASTGRAVLPPLVGHTDIVTCVAFSPDGKRIVSGSMDARVCVWDALLGVTHLAPIIGSPVQAVSFSPDGRHVVSGSDDAKIRIWEVETGQVLHKIRIWEVETSRVLHKNRNWPSIMALAVSHDGRRIAAAFEHVVHVWEVTLN